MRNRCVATEAKFAHVVWAVITVPDYIAAASINKQIHIGFVVEPTLRKCSHPNSDVFSRSEKIRAFRLGFAADVCAPNRFGFRNTAPIIEASSFVETAPIVETTTAETATDHA